jgi:hypothetical protein
VITKPVNLARALELFDAIHRPRIVASINDYDVRIAHARATSPGASILMFEPRGTATTGDRHEGEIPDHIDSTTGHALG